MLLSLRKSYHLLDFIRISTHEHGGTLDLLITPDNFSLTNITVHPPSLSDHSFISFCLPVGTLPPHTISFMSRPWRDFDIELFRQRLSSSPLCISIASLSSLSPDQLALLYHDTLSSIIEDLIPARFFNRCHAVVSPWFDSDCRSHRRRVRMFERRFRRSQLPSDKLLWIRELRELSCFYEQKETLYWEAKVTANRSSCRRLWRTFDNLLGRNRQAGPPDVFTAVQFEQFFLNKVKSVRDY